MNEIKMSDIPIGNKMVVKGGWIAYIPSVRPDSPEWAAYFLRYKGPRGALEHLQKVVNNAVVRGWLPGLRIAVRKWAKEHLRVHGSLDSFDPGKLQYCYLPGIRVGRRGNPELRRLR